ncbi:hypothetical protein ACHQM5_009706 [Ranunculus cassubicifolius]
MRKYVKKLDKKEAWSEQEDQRLTDYIQAHGEGCWNSVPQALGLHRDGKSCRLRWMNYLKPNLKRGNFGEDEDDLIIKLHALLGDRWGLIAGRLPGRTEDEVKNYWNLHLTKKLVKMGIDPNNHRLSHHKRKFNQPEPVDQEVSDAGSSVEVDTPTLPGLNLDLTMTIFPSASLTWVKEVEQHADSKTVLDLGNESSPNTLLLFR